ncbi:hypothetical protein BJX99DRAFT_221757 [Aspergillus californicus]
MPQKSSKPGKTSSKDTSSRAVKKTSISQQSRRKEVQTRQRQKQTGSTTDESQDENQIDIADTIPLKLQQLLLNVFKAALLPNRREKAAKDQESKSESEPDPTEEEPLDIKTLIQTMKSHLYNRDFDSAFADADERLLRAYALRWSATRALGYAGLLKSIMRILTRDQGVDLKHVVCIGGGAGAEIVALAAVWRNLIEEEMGEKEKDLSGALDAVTLEETDIRDQETNKDSNDVPETPRSSQDYPDLSITAVDIADWSTVMDRLASTMKSPTVSGTKSCPAPLLSLPARQNGDGIDTATDESKFEVNFQRLDVLSLPDLSLSSLLHSPRTQSPTSLVTLMFTLNELFSTSMSKATAFLLRTTDLLQPGTILLVVDSPGSYSTLKLGKGGESGSVQERQYPMKFLLDHTLLSVAKGKWERIYSQDSRWWRRDAARLWYDVGEGAGLEDMRFQIHVYRRV